jgi:hypothetical protein
MKSKSVESHQKSKPATPGSRVRAARSDASISKMQGTIELAFGLPVGSVKLVGPRRSSKLDEGATIGDLREVWASK